MRWVVGVAVLAFLAGCSHDKGRPMGDDAPKFGSKPEFSTLQGFVVGSWRQTHDPTIKSESDTVLNIGDSLFYSVLDLTADGKATMRLPTMSDCVGHGPWTVRGDVVSAGFTDVDGLSFAEVQAQWDKRAAEPPSFSSRSYRPRLMRHIGPTQRSIEISRYQVMEQCNLLPDLAVAPGGRQLQAAVEPSGKQARMFGKAVWERVK
jgi:hypothetical protein